jgi:L-serine/L-threonine ammonia-lyase
MTEPLEPLHIRTPLLRSGPLSRALGSEVWLKMDALQPTGSFKIRGIGAACQRAVRDGAERLVSASGGNAGQATAYAGRCLGVPVTVVTPTSTSGYVHDLLRAEGATVLVHGDAWDETHLFARELAGRESGRYIHPFDDPVVWEGHASLVHEVAEAALRPDAVVTVVGGGGLLCGVLQGMHAVGWTDVPVVAVETEGAASYAAAIQAGHLVTLDRIRSIATTLGARTVAAEALAWAGRHPVHSRVVSDAEAVAACRRFADEHRVLVEPACGAALAAVYGKAQPLRAKERVLVIVCGGAGVTLELLDRWERELLRQRR